LSLRDFSRALTRSSSSLYRAEYVKKNAKASPAFTSEAEREKVFGVFERYDINLLETALDLLC
jgi:hypothetical protein